MYYGVADVSVANQFGHAATCGPGHCPRGTVRGVRAFAYATGLATLSRMAVNGSSLARYL
jgi:hypothetical protein